MNKLERRVKGTFKFKKRLKHQRILNTSSSSVCHAFKTTGKPCSCAICSPGKVEEKAKYRFNKFTKRILNDELWDAEI